MQVQRASLSEPRAEALFFSGAFVCGLVYALVLSQMVFGDSHLSGSQTVAAWASALVASSLSTLLIMSAIVFHPEGGAAGAESLMRRIGYSGLLTGVSVALVSLQVFA